MKCLFLIVKQDLTVCCVRQNRNMLSSLTSSIILKEYLRKYIYPSSQENFQVKINNNCSVENKMKLYEVTLFFFLLFCACKNNYML